MSSSLANSWATTPLETRLELIHREKRRRSFRAFVDHVYPRFKWYRHCRVLADVLQRVADGEIKRLMIFMPPRHGKSLLTSRLFAAYWLYRYPEQWVGLNSYGADLAFTLSRSARDNFAAAGGAFSESASAVNHWETSAGGGMWAAGVGGPISGKGFNCIPGDTMVQSPLGDMTIRKIVEIGRPVPVYSYNHATSRVEVKMARRFMRRPADGPLVRIRVGRRTIEATPEHPVYVVGKGYIPAIDVAIGDRVLCLQRGLIPATIAAPLTFASRASRLAGSGVSALTSAICRIVRRTHQWSSANSVASTSPSHPRI
jgi:hypothetical protein